MRSSKAECAGCFCGAVGAGCVVHVVLRGCGKARRLRGCEVEQADPGRGLNNNQISILAASTFQNLTALQIL